MLSNGKGKKAHLFLLSAQKTIPAPPGPPPAEEGADGAQRGPGPAARPWRVRTAAPVPGPGPAAASPGERSPWGVDGARKDFFF